MEVGRRRLRRRRLLQVETTYTSGLQLYTDPPTGNVALAEVDEIAFERLKILRTVERVNLSGFIRGSNEWVDKLYEEFAKNKFFIHMAEKGYSGKGYEDVCKARRQDHISHYILRLLYCRTEDFRRWFLTHETDLFKARFLRASKVGSDVKAFLAANKLHYTSTTNEEKQRERENLICSSMYLTGDNFDGMTIYKVEFEDALELVKQLKVFVKNGFAFVPESDLATLVTNSFRTKLSGALATTYRALPAFDNDERLSGLFADFDRRYTGQDYSSNTRSGARITTDMVDSLADKSFPPCMRHLNDTLRTVHHLKFYGRLTYGLFLKAAGLSLVDALEFWRSHFLHNMDGDKFEKQYAYGIRYNYGKEGKRKDFAPYGCNKIITNSTGAADTTGCPFKNTDAPVLRQRLNGYGVPQQVVNDIMELAGKHHYQIACQRYWEALHGVPIDGGINHPNQFFEESQKALNGGVQPSKGKAPLPEVKTTPAVMYSSQPSSQPSNSTQDTSSFSELDSAFDDDIDSAMLEQSMEDLMDH